MGEARIDRATGQPELERDHGKRRRPVGVPKSIRVAGAALLVSGLTHVAQVFVYHDFRILFGVSVFGVAYFLIGWFLLQGRKTALWAGATLPVVGGTAAVYRLFYVQPNPFSVWHLGIDFIVVPVCVWWLIRWSDPGPVRFRN